MRTVTIALLILPVLLLASACAEPMEPDIEPTIEPHVEQLELIVDPIPGEIDTNVPKISGKVSDPGAAVYVNDSKALVLEDGTFFTYIEIPPRVPTPIEVRAESSTQEASKSFTTTFYPRPYLWVTLFDARSDPARMEGWVSYPEAQLHVEIGGDPFVAEITGNLIDAVAVEIGEDGFFTAEFSLPELSEAEGYVRPGEEVTRYDVTYRVSTPRGIAGRFTLIGTTMNSIYRPPPFLDDSPPETMKVYAERGKTVLVDRILRFRQPSPRTRSLEIVPDPKRGAVSENLHVSVEPRSILAYPLASYNSTIIIRAGDEVPSGSYFFNFRMWGFVEVVVE